MTEPATSSRAQEYKAVFVMAWVVAVVLVIAFFVLGRMYFTERMGSMDEAAAKAAATAQVRALMPSFAGFAILLCGGIGCAVLWPRVVGHTASIVVALAAGVGCFAVTSTPLPLLLSIVLGAVAALLLILGRMSLRGDRAAWAFITAMTGVMGLCTVFGAPKMRELIGVNMWITMLVPAMAVIGVVGLGKLGRSYLN